MADPTQAAPQIQLAGAASVGAAAAAAAEAAEVGIGPEVGVPVADCFSCLPLPLPLFVPSN